MIKNVTAEDVRKIIKKQKEIKKQADEVRDILKNYANLLKPEVLNNLTYEDCKEILDAVRHLVEDKTVLTEMEEILANKKVLKYPELLKAVYYPEINTLNIPDADKLRLDKLSRKYHRSYLHKRSRQIKDFKDGDMELLESIGIVEKYHRFACNECGSSCAVMSDSDFKKHERVWELKKTSPSSDELEKLYEEGYGEIYVCCDECCQTDILIDSMEEYQECEDLVCYRFMKEPDLTYEKL